MRQYLKSLLFAVPVLFPAVAQGEGDGNPLYKGIPEAVVECIEDGSSWEKCSVLGNVQATLPPTKEDPFAVCIREKSQWSECYSPTSSNQVGAGFSGFYGRVYEKGDFDMDSVWLASPAELATSGLKRH